MIPIVEVRPLPATNGHDCSDRDEDCDSIADKEHCWIYAPERGMCPFLRPTSPETPQ